MGLSS
jgi:hypothetical protein